MNRKFILNADDFGMSKAYNKAVSDGYNFGILKSASLCANGEAFEEAVNEIIPSCEYLSVGVHLNIIEGKSLTNVPLLTDDSGIFNNGYGAMIIKSFSKKYMQEVETEFRAQIEKIQEKIKVDHIDSHVHTHAIPNIFNLTVKLAKEYNIPYIRTQYEKPYFAPSLNKHLNFKYPVNIIKIILLNTFTAINKINLHNSGLKTNDYLIGVGYTGMMDDMSIEYGLKALKGENFVAEALIHPCHYELPVQDSHNTEFLITQNEELKCKISEMNIEIVNHNFT
jgi:predicted glycoside hydrolase/deacetylase ChbG (UPF0249 family)